MKNTKIIIRRFLHVVKRESMYIWIKKIVNKIPCWYLRKILYLFMGMKIGSGSRINAGTIIDTPKNVVIGERCIINENSYLDGRGGLRIGNDVSISIYSKIITASHISNSNTFEYYNDPVVIHDNVWIGVGAIILNGSQINNNAIIGAGCVFKGVAQENGIYAGNPAKMIKTRTISEKYRISNLVFFR